MVYISTGGFNDICFYDAVKYLNNYGITNFELSGGLYKDNIKEKMLDLNFENNFVIHNYFPPHQKPFVFNLASLNEDIAQQSIKHAQLAIDYSSMINSPVYSFHAGYLIDPKVDELGKIINKRSLNPINKSMDVFISRVNSLSKYAKKKNIKLMIENNVLSKKNYDEFKDCPLLMIESDQTKEILNKTDENVGLLIDVAHLKVSANTLKFSGADYLQKFYNSIEGYHLSDNDGLSDSNGEISKDSWFWPYINRNLKYYSLEIYKNDGSILKSQLEITKEMLNKC